VSGEQFVCIVSRVQLSSKFQKLCSIDAVESLGSTLRWTQPVSLSELLADADRAELPDCAKTYPHTAYTIGAGKIHLLGYEEAAPLLALKSM